MNTETKPYRLATSHHGAINALHNKLNHKQNIHTMKCNGHTHKEFNKPTTTTLDLTTKTFLLWYIHGLGEMFKRTCNNFGIQVHFRGVKHHQIPQI